MTNELTPTERVNELRKKVDQLHHEGRHASAFGLMSRELFNLATELERVQLEIEGVRMLHHDLLHERDDLKRQVELARATALELTTCDDALHLAESLAKVSLENKDLKRQVEELTANRDQCAAVFKIDREHEITGPIHDCACPSCNLCRVIGQLRAENTELLKDRKRLERLMTLERGDLLWFYQEQDKRRALDILMEDNE